MQSVSASGTTYLSGRSSSYKIAPNVGIYMLSKRYTAISLHAHGVYRDLVTRFKTIAMSQHIIPTVVAQLFWSSSRGHSGLIFSNCSSSPSTMGPNCITAGVSNVEWMVIIWKCLPSRRVRLRGLTHPLSNCLVCATTESMTFRKSAHLTIHHFRGKTLPSENE